jgi:hypothetical protein
MQFTTKSFTLTLEGLNKKLGIHKNIDIDYFNENSYVKWLANINANEWSIKSIYADILDYHIEICYSIDKEDLNSKDIQHLLSLELGEFYPVKEGQTFIEGKIILGKDYDIKNFVEMAADTLSINEVIVNFDEKKIIII